MLRRLRSKAKEMRAMIDLHRANQVQIFMRGFKRQISSQAFQIQQKGVWMFAHSWRANIHPKGRSHPAQQQDGLQRAWWVAIKLRNLPAKSVKNVDSRTGKQMQVLEIPMYFFSFYSFTGIDSHFARNGLLGLIGHSSRVKDPLPLSVCLSLRCQERRDGIRRGGCALKHGATNRNGFGLIPPS